MTIYANVVNVRSTGEDVVFEFGCFFPNGDQQFPPQDFPPELRVVLSADLLGPLVDDVTGSHKTDSDYCSDPQSPRQYLHRA